MIKNFPPPRLIEHVPPGSLEKLREIVPPFGRYVIHRPYLPDGSVNPQIQKQEYRLSGAWSLKACAFLGDTVLRAWRNSVPPPGAVRSISLNTTYVLPGEPQPLSEGRLIGSQGKWHRDPHGLYGIVSDDPTDFLVGGPYATQVRDWQLDTLDNLKAIEDEFTQQLPRTHDLPSGLAVFRAAPGQGALYTQEHPHRVPWNTTGGILERSVAIVAYDAPTAR